MGFFTLSNNQGVETDGNFEMGGGAPIPNNTNCKACIDEIGWDQWEGEEYIKARWTVLDGEYQNRKVFQKIKVNESDVSKRDKAIRMLAAIDANCGGKLMSAGTEPTDEELLALTNRPMVIKVMTWEINGKSGNWIAAVSSLQAQAAAPVQNGKPEITDEDVPF